VLTVPSVGGGDTVYVVDNRTGLMAVFAFDNRARVLRPQKVRAVQDAFQ
jgi:hypothetical protein